MLASFYAAGFECAMGINQHGQPFDQIAATGHDRLVDQDYRGLREVGVQTIRDGVRWPLVDRGRGHDFASLVPMLEAAARHGMEVIWDLFHYGYPSDLHPLCPRFAARFADYCHASARLISARLPPPWYFTPMNEPSYFAWAAGEAGTFAPHLHGQGRLLKEALIAAAIRGIDAIRAACPGARLVNIDPLCWAVAPAGRADLEAQARDFNNVTVFECFDMLCGRSYPELGGSRAHLDIVGLNYYQSNQWRIDAPGLPLADGDPARSSLHALVNQVHQRYGGDLMITETSQQGDQRGPWIDQLAMEVEAMLDAGIPLLGACIYPALAMPEWQEREVWRPLGLWDVVDHQDGLGRRPQVAALAALARAAARLKQRQATGTPAAPPAPGPASVRIAELRRAPGGAAGA